ncbi:MAG: hypothetical protein M3464_06095 [Chloroflexota bacterium]|nr:hypothetical protein [Chloroflexota bacterium]
MPDRVSMYAEIDAERDKQNRAWAPPEYSVPPSPAALLREVREVTARTMVLTPITAHEKRAAMRRRFVVAAAVAIAGIEAIDAEEGHAMMLPTFAVGNLETRLLQIDDALSALECDDDPEQTDQAAALTDERGEIMAILDVHDDAVLMELADGDDDDPICVCGVHRSEHILCGCPDGFERRR